MVIILRSLYIPSIPLLVVGAQPNIYYALGTMGTTRALQVLTWLQDIGPEVCMIEIIIIIRIITMAAITVLSVILIVIVELTGIIVIIATMIDWQQQ